LESSGEAHESGDVFGWRSFEYFRRCPFGEKLPLDEDSYPVGEGPGFSAVVDDDERGALWRSERGCGVVEEVGSGRGVKAGEGFVEEEDVWFCDEATG
jgi:hypothetical protein